MTTRFIQRREDNINSNSKLSTQNSTNMSQNEQNKSTQISKDDKNYYHDLENLSNHIKEVYPAFTEQFELTHFINSGSEGVVYEGKYKKGYDNQKYAFKFCIKKKKEENKEKNKFHEISIVKKLHHKNVNQILAFIKLDDSSYFSVLELGKYGDLDYFSSKLLKRSKLSETCVNYLAKPILEALEYIHRCKFIHMDIKPGNILIDSELNPKIIDFSAACSFSEFNNEDLVKFPFIGTGKFIPPEIIERAHMKIKYGEEIDVYSFGVTLFYLIFGMYPYNLNEVKGKEYDKILEKVKSEKLIFPKEIKVSEKCKDFLSKLLDKDYRNRITIKNALKHPWIQAHHILEEEKLNTANQENFLIKLITDSIPKFNEYMK